MSEFDPSVAYENIRKQGFQFGEDRQITELTGITYMLPGHTETFMASADNAVVKAHGAVYARDQSTIGVLRQIRGEAPVYGTAEAYNMLQRCVDNGRMILSVSGYATGGFPYTAETDVMEDFYDSLQTLGIDVGVSIDGASQYGVLGANGLIAQKRGITNVGITPFQGMHRIGVRDELVVWGEDYQQRETIIGTAPDLLACFGGSKGSARECQRAIEYGSAVLVVDAKEYADPTGVSKTLKDFEGLEEAEENGQLVVCRPGDNLREKLEMLEPHIGRSDMWAERRLQTTRFLLAEVAG